MVRVPATRTLENALRRVGFVHVAGVDEVGRGCLAGPVVAAAVVLHPEKSIPGLADSKVVPAPERGNILFRLAELLREHKNELTPERRKAAEPAIAKLVRTAYLLDAFGDIGNKQQISEAYAKFLEATKDIHSSFPQSATRNPQ